MVTEKSNASGYAVIFENAGRNWSAYVPDLPGCITTGKTLEDTRKNIAEAIQAHIAFLRRHGDPVPEPTTRAALRNRRLNGK